MKGNRRAGHDLGVSGGARVNIAASRLDSLRQVYIWLGSRVTITASSLVNSTIYIDGDLSTAGVTLLRNDLTLLPNWYLLWVLRTPQNLLSVRSNCLYCPNALRAEVAISPHFEGNYWGHALRPNFPPAKVNPEGAGISEANPVRSSSSHS